MPPMFQMEKIARDYLWPRYPKASLYEKEKYVHDWVKKVEVSKKIASDYERRVSSLDGKKIFDAGCGNGGLSIAFSQFGAHVSGIEVEADLYKISIAHGESYNSPAEFFLYDGIRLPFADNFFDGAVSVSVLEHTDDPVLYLKEILRVLKPNSSLYLAFPNRLWPKETHTGLWFLTYVPVFWMNSIIKIFKRNPIEENNLHFYTFWDLKKFLTQSVVTGYRWDIKVEKGETTNFIKKSVKNILSIFGFSHRMFLPHIAVILTKKSI